MEIYGNVIMLFMLSACAVMDVVKKHLHVVLLLIFGLLGILFQTVRIVQLLQEGLSPDFRSIVFGLCLAIVIVIASKVSRERIGMGDALLILDCSVFMGFWGVLSLMWMACLFAGILGFILIFVCKKSKNYRIPFAPFLFGSYVILLFLDMYGGFT